MIFRQIDSESYNGLPCIYVAIDQAYKSFGKEFPARKMLEFPLFKNNELFDKNGYCSLRKARECINYLFKVKSYKFIKGKRRKPLKEYDLIGKYIILVKGHYVASWNNIYFSLFNNDNDEVVALWELEDVDDEKEN